MIFCGFRRSLCQVILVIFTLLISLSVICKRGSVSICLTLSLLPIIMHSVLVLFKVSLLADILD